MVDGGLVLDMLGLVGMRIDGDCVAVQAGTRWDALVAATAAVDRVPPVLTDYLGLTVGGTLSVGGVGGQSFAHGLQTCNVESLVVVTADAEVLECSATDNADLFDACRGGLGQCAVVVEARLRLIRAPACASIVNRSYPTLEAMLDAQRACAEQARFDYILAKVPIDADGRWDYQLELVRYHRVEDPPAREVMLDGLGGRGDTVEVSTFLEHATRLSAVEQDLLRGAHHPWMDLFVPGSVAAAFLAAAIAELDPRGFADGHVMTYPILRDRCNTPLVILPDEPYCVLFDILPTVHADADLTAMTRRLDRILDLAEGIGARPYPIGYPVGAPRMGEALWRRVLDWPRLQAAKKAHDPSGRLAPGPGIPWDV